MGMKVGLVVVVLVLVLTGAPVGKCAISCGTVVSKLSPCISYLKGKVKVVPTGCCGGVKGLNGLARTTADRQAACNCLKSASTTIKGINLRLAAALPAKCRVSIPYKISPSVNCNTVK